MASIYAEGHQGFLIYRAKNLPMHMYCEDTEENVKLCIEGGSPHHGECHKNITHIIE